MVMPRRSTFPLVDRLLGGHLAEFISERRARGLSFEDISYELRTEHDITVSGETVRAWSRLADEVKAS